MKTIVLQQVLPDVFAQGPIRPSEVWRSEVKFEKGKHYLVEAQSGAGKSTLCSYLTGYRNDYAGSILFDGMDIRRLTENDWSSLRRRHLSLLFQELRLFPELTAMENVEIKNKLTRWKSPKEIAEWFERLGIADKMEAKVGRLSYGQQQRVALLRSLVQPFDFFLADEPISHLDEANSETMAALLAEESERQGAAIVVTSIGKHLPLPYDHVLRL